MKAIFLVGDFGQNTYLRRYLHNYYTPDIEVLAPVDSWTAFVRVALMKTAGEVSSSATKASIESRVAGKHHGLSIRTNYIEICA